MIYFSPFFSFLFLMDIYFSFSLLKKKKKLVDIYFSFSTMNNLQINFWCLHFQSRLISLIFNNKKKKIIHFLLYYEVHWCLFDSLLVVFSYECVISLGLVERLWSKTAICIQYYISFFLSHTFSFFYCFVPIQDKILTLNIFGIIFVFCC